LSLSVRKSFYYIHKDLLFCFSSQSRRVDFLEYLPNIDPLRSNSTQATADLNNDLVAG